MPQHPDRSAPGPAVTAATASAAVALPGAPARATSAERERRRIESQALFDGRVEIEIAHFEQVYRLRQTSLGKLILTK